MVERCNPVCWPDGYGGTDPCMQIDKSGEYISYADHEAELAKLRLNTGCAQPAHHAVLRRGRGAGCSYNRAAGDAEAGSRVGCDNDRGRCTRTTCRRQRHARRAEGGGAEHVHDREQPHLAQEPVQGAQHTLPANEGERSMKMDEIRTLVSDCQRQAHIQDWHARHLITAIEALLAREDDALKYVDRFVPDMHAINIRAILNPERENLITKAKRLGFDDMPTDIGQRNIDGETNYAVLPASAILNPEENEND